jgi:hypothetical protein
VAALAVVQALLVLSLRCWARPAGARWRHGLRGGRRPRLAVPVARDQRAEPGAPHLDRLGFQPVEDAGIEGLASDQEPSDDNGSTRPDDVAELIAAEGTA